jgi:Zn-dependent protease
MKGTIDVIKILGIPVRVHWSFSILLFYIIGIGWYKNIDYQAITLNFVFIIAVFLCVLLHELGHALMAKKFKIQTKEIIILPVGGVAMFEYGRVTAMQEFVIAFAGPLTNFSIAFFLYLGLFFLTPVSFDYIGVRSHVLNVSTSFSERLLWINLIIGGFNLIPTLPLDGGVMLRALLTNFTNPFTAAKLSFMVSLFAALGFVIYSYYFQAPEYLFFAWFIYFYARKSNKVQQ